MDSFFDFDQYSLDKNEFQRSLFGESLTERDPYRFQSFGLESRARSDDPYGYKSFAYSQKKYMNAMMGTQPSASEQELVGIKSQGEPKKLSWWRDNEEYMKWLASEGYDDEYLTDEEGNRMYLGYVKSLAEERGKDMPGIFKKFGGVVQAVGDAIEGIPLVEDVAHGTVTLLSFFGNLLDMPMNIVRSIVTSVGAGHPEEVFGNAWEAFKHGVTGGKEGGYFSFLDYQLQNKIDEARQGMSEEEFKEYMDSDEYRQVKRSWQLGGLLLDVVVDPMWLMATTGKLSKLPGIMAKGEDVTADLVRTAGRISETFKMTEMPMHEVLSKSAEMTRAVSSQADKARKLFKAVSENDDWLKLGQMEKATAEALSKTDDIIKLADGFMDYASKVNDAKWMTPKPYWSEFGKKTALHVPFTGRFGQKLGYTGERKVMFTIGPELEGLRRSIFRRLGSDMKSTLDVGARQFRGTMKHLERTRDRIAIKRSAERINAAADDLVDYMNTGNPEKVFTREDALDHINEVIATSGYKENMSGKDWARYTFEEEVLQIDGVATRARLHKDILVPSLEEGLEQADKAIDTVKGLYSNGEYEDVLIHLLGDKNVREMIQEWGTVSKKILKEEAEARAKNLELFKRSGFVREAIGDDGKAYLVFDDYGMAPKVVMKGEKGIGKTKAWKHNTIAYRPAYPTKEFQKLIFEQLVHKNSLGHPSELLNQPTRMLMVPSKYNDLESLKKLYPALEDAKEFTKVEKLFLDAATSEREKWFTALNRVRDLQQTSDGWKLVQNLIQEGVLEYTDVHRANLLAEAGLLFDGFNKKVFDLSPAVFAERIKKTDRLLAETEALQKVIPDGLKDGWMQKKFIDGKRVNPEKIPKYAGKYKWVSGSGAFQGFYIPEHLVEMVNTFSRGLLRFHVPFGSTYSPVIQNVLKASMKFNSYWRHQMTIKHPQFHARNLVSNRVMLLGEGRPFYKWIIPDEITNDSRNVYFYSKYLDKKARGTLTNTQAKRLNQLESMHVMDGMEKVPIPVAYERLLKNGVIGTSHTEDISKSLRVSYVGETEEELSKLKKFIMPFTGKTKNIYSKKLKKYNVIFGTEDIASEVMGDLGRYVEECAGRIEGYFHLRKNKGMNIDQASRRVNHIFVDYNALSEGEKALRNYLIPFYTWRSRMIGVMGGQMIQNPVMFTSLVHLRENAFKMLEVNELLRTKYEAKGEGIPFVNAEDLLKFMRGERMSEISVSYISGEGFLPQSAINVVDFEKVYDLLDPRTYVSGLTDELLQGLTPAIKLAVEENLNYSFFFGREIERYPGELKQFLGLNLPPKVANIVRSVFGFRREAEDFINLWRKNAYTGKPNMTVYELIQKHAFGTRPYTHDEIRELNRWMGQVKDIYRFNAQAARSKKFDVDAQIKHASSALEAKYMIDILEWYKQFLAYHKSSREWAEILRERAGRKRKYLKEDEFNPR